MFTTDDIKKRAKQQVLQEKAYKSASKHIYAAQKHLLKVGFTKDDTLIEALDIIMRKLYTP